MGINKVVFCSILIYKEQFKAGKLGGSEATFLNLLLPYDLSQWREDRFTLK